MASIKIEDLATEAQELSSKQMGAVIGGRTPFFGTGAQLGNETGFSRYARRTVTVQRNVQVQQVQRLNYRAYEFAVESWRE
ncbi:MAG: hypothetical protein O3B01_06750 [Planctomycetota bacterium]|nr:hypothetical protein [Planctomycetota bacterium]